MTKKNRSPEETVTEDLKTAADSGTQSPKTNLDKALRNCDQLVGFGKQNAVAMGKAASAAGKGAESLHDEFYAYSRRSIENSFAAANALFRAKSLAEAFELQSGFAKSAFEAYADEVTKLSQIALTAARESFEPLKGRAEALMNAVRSAQAD
jgi:phasin family protein